MVNKNLIDIFMEKIYSEPAWTKYNTNLTVVNNIHDFWSLKLPDMIGYGFKN